MTTADLKFVQPSRLPGPGEWAFTVRLGLGWHANPVPRVRVWRCDEPHEGECSGCEDLGLATIEAATAMPVAAVYEGMFELVHLNEPAVKDRKSLLLYLRKCYGRELTEDSPVTFVRFHRDLVE